MSIAEHIQLTRKLKLAAFGSPGDTTTVTLESGSPYRHYMAWVYVLSAIPIPNIDVQPKFAGVNDGAPVTVNSKGAIVVFKVPTEEIRPSTRGLHTHPDDEGPPYIMKSELEIQNQDALNEIELSVYMLATATVGGA